MLAQVEAHEDGRLLGLGPQGARAALRRLEARAGVTPVQGQATQALRHSSGTRLYRETGDLETVARHLGHSSLETSRVYAKWSDERLKATLGEW